MPSIILNENYLDLDVLANNSVSSEQAAFPVLNAYNTSRRSKVWRSNGYWEITSSTNTFTFKETGLASILTATVPPASYTSTVSLLAALKTAMEDVSVDTFTLTVDSDTSKIKISSSGSDFQIVSGGTLNSLLGFTTLPKTGNTLYLADELKLHTSEWIKWDFGISSNPDGFCLIGRRNAPLPITPNAIIRLQANSTDVWDDPEYDQVLTYSDSIINLFKEDGADGLHTNALRYWRLYIEDKSNPNGYVEIGALFLGDYFLPSRGRIQFPFKGDYIDLSNIEFSEGGQTFSDVREKSERFSINWNALTTADKERIDEIFDTFGISTAFFIGFDPDLAFSSEDGYYTRFVKFTSPPSYSLERPNFWSVSMDFREEL